MRNDNGGQISTCAKWIRYPIRLLETGVLPDKLPWRPMEDLASSPIRPGPSSVIIQREQGEKQEKLCVLRVLAVRSNLELLLASLPRQPATRRNRKLADRGGRLPWLPIH